MKIEILRGKEHIGGSIIKVRYDRNCILLDCGALLPELGEPVEDDFDMGRVKDAEAVFLSRHHGDHSGRIEELPRSMALYASKGTLDLMNTLDDFWTGPRALAAGRCIYCKAAVP